MNVLVCGGRDYDRPELLEISLDALRQNIGDFTVIEGEATGADSMARDWAESRGLPVLKFPADWDKYGRTAGPIRNRQMLVEGQPDLVVYFHPDLETSRGTKNMVQQARKAGIRVVNGEDPS